MYIIRLKDCKSVNMFFFNHQKLLYDKCFVYVVEKKMIWETQIFFFKNTPFYIIKQDSRKRIMPCKKEKK
jgi:CMP-N-acetylneuraminic acid synthetase